MNNFDCGVSFSFDQRELVQEVTLRLRSARWRVFMCDAEAQEGGVLWEWLQESYASCKRIAIFVNHRYLQRPVTRRELQYFAGNTELWGAGRVHMFGQRGIGGSISFASGFPCHETSEAREIAGIMLNS